MRKELTALVLFASIGLLVSACGGGGGGSDTPPPNSPPIASFTATPSSGTVPLTVQFNASASADSGGSIAGYSWNFGDNSAAGSGATTSHVFQAAGVYTVTLTVTDNLGATGLATHQVTVSNIAVPNVVGLTQGAATTTIVGAGLAVGSITSATSATVPAGAVISQNPAAGSLVTPGSSVSLVISSGSGSNPPPPNSPPIASFTATPSSGSVPLTVQFNASGSIDADGAIASYGWIFGDGSAAGSGVTVSHVYQTAGTYAVTLTVTDNLGATNSSTRQVIVSSVSGPELTLSASPQFVASGQTATLTWDSQFVSSCTASGGWSGIKPVFGSVTTPPITATTTYTLTCSGPGGQIARSASVQVNSVGGRLLISSTSQSDSDVNDPNAPFQSNDVPATAQQLPNPVVVGGYVNEPNRGPDGRSYAIGDLDDAYKVDLSSGQVIELVLPSADPNLPDAERDDADLYLYDQSGILVDASEGLGQIEQITVPASGTYFVRVSIYSGAPLYRLSIGQMSVANASALLKLSDEFVTGEVIVTLRNASVTPTARQKAAATVESTFGMRRKAGDSSREMLMAIPENAAQVVQLQKPRLAADLGTGFTVPPALQRKLATLQYIKLLRTNPSVRAADPNRIMRISAVPNDPLYSVQRWHYEQIQLPAAWNVTTGSASVVVAIVDSGVVGHPDLVAKLSDGYDFVSSPLNQDGDGIDANPDDPGCTITGGSVFHGTHVAGTVAAATNDGVGVAGVAWNTRLMPVRVLDGCSGGGTLYDVAQGVRYAAGLSNDAGRLPAKRADVINLSLGGAGPCDPTSANLAAEVRAQGVVVVAAAGNENTNELHSPASCPNVISVSSVGPTRQKASYSNFGSWVDIAAPGGEMNLDSNGDGYPDGILSTSATGGGADRVSSFAFLQGTSMAAPHVSGVIALMESVKPGLTPAEVDTLLAQGLLTDDIGAVGPDELGIGLINAFKAVQAVSSTDPPVPPVLTVTPSSLNFGDIGTLTEVIVSNGGSGTLSITGTTTSDAWLGVIPASIDADGLGRYEITVERGSLSIGTYSGWVDFSSSAGTTRVSVLMQVVISPAVPDAGWQYGLLVDPVSNTAVAGLSGQARGASVSYRFSAIPAGDYLIVAGTDMNNDGFICDDGEACGAYPVLSSPEVVSVAGERLGLDFSTAFQAGLQAASSSVSNGNGGLRKRPGFPRKR